MVRDAPDTHTETPPHATHRAFPRRALIALIAITVAVMIWGGLAGYVVFLLVGLVLVVVLGLAYVLTGASTTK